MNVTIYRLAPPPPPIVDIKPGTRAYARAVIGRINRFIQTNGGRTVLSSKLTKATGPITWRGVCACDAVVTVTCPTHTSHAARWLVIECPNGCGNAELHMQKVVR
jgi:hypothetical protein